MNEWEWRALEDRPPVDRLLIGDVEITTGSRVRLRPRRTADAFDMVMTGKTALVASIEQDYEGAFHLSVVLDDDPGRDLGLMRQPGHRFFFAPADVEPLTDEESAAAAATVAAPLPSILIAGIGNIFLGDDGFGVEVARRLAGGTFPDGVRVADYGIRGLDLVYALMDAPDVIILVDACPRGDAPGTLYVIEPDLDPPATDGNGGTGEPQPAFVDAHAMNPMQVLRAARTMGGQMKRILILGCEPETLGPPEGQLGLSDPVAAAVDEAVDLVHTLVRDIRRGHTPRAASA
jgi:hydrogenase maturation protease